MGIKDEIDAALHEQGASADQGQASPAAEPFTKDASSSNETPEASPQG